MALRKRLLAGRVFLLIAALIPIVALIGISGASAHSNTVRLTTDPGYDAYPVYSPSGSKIAFIRVTPEAVELWIMNSDGSGQMKANDGDVVAGGGDFPQWSPDNKRLVFWKYGESGIFDVTLRTGAVRQLAPSGFQIDVSPNGRKIVFSDFHIYLMDADGQNLTDLTPDLPYAVQPAWSPDGKKIAFVGTRDDTGRSFIFVMNADGSNVQDITATYPDLQGQFPVWSPNGKKIAFTGIFPTGDSEEIDIFVMKADGSGLVDVSNIPLGTEDVKVWSPDGQMIAFDSYGNAATDGVCTVRANGNHLQCSAGASSPSWAPNGKRIAFHGALDGQDNSDIYTMVAPNH